jgi:hypothetical protein
MNADQCKELLYYTKKSFDLISLLHIKKIPISLTFGLPFMSKIDMFIAQLLFGN